MLMHQTFILAWNHRELLIKSMIRCLSRVLFPNAWKWPKLRANATPHRAGYRSKIFHTNTLSSIPVPERYFFQYQFYKSILTRLHYLKNVGFIFSACWHLYRLKASSPEPLHKGTNYIQHNKSVQNSFNEVKKKSFQFTHLLAYIYICIYSFSRRFYPKRLTIEEYNKRYIIKRQTDTGSACNTHF